MDRIRLGLVGCGSFAAVHMQAFRNIREAEVAAVFDFDLPRARRLAAAFGVPKVCGSIEELCEMPELAALDVVTTDDAHLGPVLAALCGGKHVFVEKPLAPTLDACARMIDAAEAAGRFLMVGHVLRFETKYALLKEELQAGRLGEVISMHTRRNRTAGHLPACDRTHPAMENTIHDIDIMLWYAARPVRRVRGYGRRTTHRRNPDTFWGVIEFEGGAIGVAETIWTLPESAGMHFDDAIEVIGTAGAAKLELLPGAFKILRKTGYDFQDVTYAPAVGDSVYGALREELAYFCACVADNRRPERITAIEAKRAVRVALALIESAEKDRDVRLSDWD